jgi:F-type H+-transporting ATPase subunit b
MRIDWWTLSLQTVNAVVLIWLLAYFLFRPVANVIAARKAAAARLLGEAEQAKSLALATQDAEKAALAEIAGGRTAALSAAREEAETQKAALLAAARADAERLRSEAQAERAREAALGRETQMKQASALAVDIAKRLVARFPPSSLVAGFIEGLARAAAALPPEDKLDFDKAEGARLKAPRALTPQEDADCRHALENAFGRPLAFSIEIDPSVIAGLELENHHTTIKNSLRADLARISDAVEAHDAQ